MWEFARDRTALALKTSIAWNFWRNSIKNISDEAALFHSGTCFGRFGRNLALYGFINPVKPWSVPRYEYKNA